MNRQKQLPHTPARNEGLRGTLATLAVIAGLVLLVALSLSLIHI